MKQGLIYPRLGLNFHHSILGFVVIRPSPSLPICLDGGIETGEQGEWTMSVVAYQQEGYNLGRGLFWEGGQIWKNLFRLLGFSKSPGKVISAHWMVPSMIDTAQLLEVFENFWVRIQLNFNRGCMNCWFSCHSSHCLSHWSGTKVVLGE